MLCQFFKLVNGLLSGDSLAELITEVEMLKPFGYHCADIVNRGCEVTREASMAKLKVGKLMREVADWCLQFHGGIDYMEETWVSRYFRDQHRRRRG